MGSFCRILRGGFRVRRTRAPSNGEICEGVRRTRAPSNGEIWEGFRVRRTRAPHSPTRSLAKATTVNSRNSQLVTRHITRNSQHARNSQHTRNSQHNSRNSQNNGRLTTRARIGPQFETAGYLAKSNGFRSFGPLDPTFRWSGQNGSGGLGKKPGISECFCSFSSF